MSVLLLVFGGWCNSIGGVVVIGGCRDLLVLREIAEITRGSDGHKH